MFIPRDIINLIIEGSSLREKYTTWRLVCKEYSRLVPDYELNNRVVLKAVQADDAGAYYNDVTVSVVTKKAHCINDEPHIQYKYGTTFVTWFTHGIKYRPSGGPDEICIHNKKTIFCWHTSTGEDVRRYIVVDHYSPDVFVASPLGEPPCTPVEIAQCKDAMKWL